MKFLGKVIGWEVWRHLRNKQFLIGLFVTPAIFALFAGIPALLERFDEPEIQEYGVVDSIGLFDRVAERLEGSTVILIEYDSTDPLPDLTESGELTGFFVLDEAFLQAGEVAVYADRPSRVNQPLLSAALGQVLYQVRMDELGIEPEVLALLNQPIDLQALPVEAAIAESDSDIAANEGMTTLAMAIGFGGILMLLVLTSGAMLLQSALQEKRDRMIEVILSSIGPQTLMFGKIIGQLILAMIQIAFWALIALPIAYYVLDVPIGDYIDLKMLPLFLAYVILGYLFFAAIFVGAGATMEDIQSAGNSQGMVFMLPVLSFVLIGPVISNPDGVIARIATLFPLTSPVITMFRMGFTDIPLWELIVGGIILLVSTYIVVKVASKIFRVGMLMYGKTATPLEIWKWLRHS